MSESFLIRSATGGASLVLRSEEKDSWIAVLSGPQVTVEVPVHGYRPHASFSGFFADLAGSWRGWAGEKTYESLQGELRLRCTHDGIGHVGVHVEVWTDHPLGDWCVRGSLIVEPGQLGDLSRAAAEFDARS